MNVFVLEALFTQGNDSRKWSLSGDLSSLSCSCAPQIRDQRAPVLCMIYRQDERQERSAQRSGAYPFSPRRTRQEALRREGWALYGSGFSNEPP
jgi:hypothetical protein